MGDSQGRFIPEALTFDSRRIHAVGNTLVPSRWAFVAPPEVVGTLWSADGTTRAVRIALTGEEATALQRLLDTAGARAQ